MRVLSFVTYLHFFRLWKYFMIENQPTIQDCVLNGVPTELAQSLHLGVSTLTLLFKLCVVLWNVIVHKPSKHGLYFAAIHQGCLGSLVVGVSSFKLLSVVLFLPWPMHFSLVIIIQLVMTLIFLSFSAAPARYVVILCTASPGSRSCDNILQNKYYFIAFFRASMRQAWSVYLVPGARWRGGDKNCLTLALAHLKNAEKCLFCRPSH